MQLILHDYGKHKAFAPFTLTRPVGNLRMGILTINERWKKYLPEASIFYRTEDYLSKKFKDSHEGIVINATVIPNRSLIEAIKNISDNTTIELNGTWIAKSGTGENNCSFQGEELIVLENRWNLYQKNAEVLEADFKLLTEGRISQGLSSTNSVIGDSSKIFLEEGAKVECAILNTTSGPIYIGKNAEIMEGSIIRGGLAMLNDSVLKLGAKVYGATTLGPQCKVGGEVNNVIFYGYSNKGHDGFLGNSIVGEWCNIGADSNTSNLKNNYSLVSAYNYESKHIEKTDVQFMGVMLGDHSKCGINTMFNTATVVGVSSNIFGAEFPPKYIPSFQWGVHGDVFNFDKAIEAANNMMVRRGMKLTDDEVQILKELY